MIIDAIDIEDISFGEATNHSPVGPNSNRPKAFPFALERVQPETRQIHVRNAASRIKARDNIAQLRSVVGKYAAPVVCIPKAFQSFVANRTDHGGA